MWCSTPRMPPSSSPPPARPGPPWTSTGSGEPWPVFSFASSRSSTRIRPCWWAAPSTNSRATASSWVTIEPTRLPCAARRELDGVRDAVVGQHRADRAECLDVVRLRGREVVAAQQHRRQEGAAVLVGADHLEVVRVAGDELGDAAQRLDRAQHLLPLVEAGERRPSVTPSAAGLPDDDLGRASPAVASTTSSISSRGTSARRIAVHF